MEERLIGELDVNYVGIFCGKLRRYSSWKNITDVFKIPVGVIQAFYHLLIFRPTVIFCKGGYVCFPVAVAGWLLKIPVILHESDVIPGLANRLCAFFTSKICLSFEESRKYFRGKKTILTGNPVRYEMVFGNRFDGLAFLDFVPMLPVLLVMGGSLGADFINKIIWSDMGNLLEQYQIVHICGEKNMKSPEALLNLLPYGKKQLLARYRLFSFVKNELKDIYAAADVVISRAGAMTLAELDFFEKPALLIPLPKKASRGDQIVNAGVFSKTHFCGIIDEEKFSSEQFNSDLGRLLKHAMHKQKKSAPSGQKQKSSPLDAIIHLLENT